ncbi:hypothetical protein D3C79_661560 [compost metagenome]
MVPGLFQLQRRTARCFAGEFQARNAHRPHRRVVRRRQADKHPSAADESQQQTWFVRILDQSPGLAQGFTQRHFELAAEGRKLLAVVGVHHLQPQAAALRIIGQGLEQDTDAVGFRQFDESTAGPLPGENQLGKTQLAHQLLGAFGVVANEFGAGALRLGLGVAGDVQACGVLGDFGTDFTFETGPAMHKQGIHLHSRTDGAQSRQP